jgi:hypothetical protein
VSNIGRRGRGGCIVANRFIIVLPFVRPEFGFRYTGLMNNGNARYLYIDYWDTDFGSESKVVTQIVSDESMTEDNPLAAAPI